MSLAKCNTDKCRVYEMPQLLYYHARLVVNNLFFFAAFPSAFLHLKRNNHVFVYFRERERDNGTKSVLESVANCTQLIFSETWIK